MDLLYRIVYAAHANGSHHKLALESLRHLSGPRSEAWRRLFLKHSELYLTASKVPDNEFKDFKNHVLHVRDRYWGGAPEKVVSWYDMLVAALRDQRWTDSVYAAGVLSHYYMDPIHPFHTAQSPAENNIHRAVEWSISKSFDTLLEIGRKHRVDAPHALPEGDHWLAEFVCRGAERSNAEYERLIAHYDFSRGVVDPPSGLDAIARDFLGDLIVYATTSFALVLDRALAESGAEPPEVALTAETFLAGLKIPAKWVVKKISDANERRLVESMYDELMATGRVEQTLPEDDRAVRDLHAQEVLSERVERQARRLDKRLPEASQALQLRKETVRADIAKTPQSVAPPAAAGPRNAPPAKRVVAAKPKLMERLDAVRPVPAQPPPSSGAESKPVEPDASEAVPAKVSASARSSLPDGAAPIAARPSVPAVPRSSSAELATDIVDPSLPAPPQVQTPAPAPPTPPKSQPTMASVPSVGASDRPQRRGVARSIADVAPIAPPVEATSTAQLETESAVSVPIAQADDSSDAPSSDEKTRSRRESHGLQEADDVVGAPSIGPKTAERLYVVGIRTVGDLLEADPDALAGKLASRHITARTIADWQSQARLVRDLPGLKGGHAQLLVGAGYRTFERLLQADTASLQADVLRYAASTDGQRVLRNGEPPDLELIASWLDLATAARDAKAA